MFYVCCPEKTKKVDYKNRNPWIDQKLKSMIAERERLLIVKVNNPTDDTISTLKKLMSMI